MSPSEAQHAIDTFRWLASFMILFVAVVLALMLMRKESHCDRCDHCRAKDRERDKVRTERNHIIYHNANKGSTSDDCKNPRCPGRQ